MTGACTEYRMSYSPDVYSRGEYELHRSLRSLISCPTAKRADYRVTVVLLATWTEAFLATFLERGRGEGRGGMALNECPAETKSLKRQNTYAFTARRVRRIATKGAPEGGGNGTRGFSPKAHFVLNVF